MTRHALGHGFTLVEVLVALALIATAFGGTLAVIRDAAADIDYLERRLYAAWVADNVVNTYRLQPEPIEQLAAGGEATILGRAFTFTLNVAQVPLIRDAARVPGSRDITVTVRGSGSGAAPLAERVFKMRLPRDVL